MHMHVAARMVEEYLDGALNVRNIRGSHPQQKPAVIQLLPLMAPSEVGDVRSEKEAVPARRAPSISAANEPP
ncbi:MAG: hypothetical protein USCAAHI_01115 [Beijerinckiaceae bacterium]|jgi:hypothetical protein|nr:MAG: hypothetical protein USCAAHI_01115 [Beijerinckiaceae bacterium]